MSSKNNAHTYAVIMAGGSGTRLWPLSRKHMPKQFHAFISQQTMIQETFQRVARIVPKDNIFVSTTDQYQALVLEQLPEITPARLIVEPQPRNTAPAIALVAATVAKIDPDAIVATIASDHAIENPEEFETTLRVAYTTLMQYPDKLVTVGINPTHPDTGLGYIKMGKEFATIEEKRIFHIDAFKEKPDLVTAEEYLSNWEYLWNAGYFIFSARQFAQWTHKLTPELYQVITDLTESLDQSLEKRSMLYAHARNEPIDTLIVEKLSAEQRLVIPSALRWSDVGSWSNLHAFLQEKNGTHMISRGQHIDFDSKNILIYGKERLVATIGLKDLIIVDTDDILLVAHRDDISANVKTLLEQLKKTDKNNLL
ncbi:MAG: mannose-1-phosphate guanylyltransferase [Minisyncoccota bacterium]